MTVEQSPLERFSSQNQKETQMVINQLKEITGVSDVTILGQALEASKNESGKYDLHQAVNILVDENSPYHQKQQQLRSQTKNQQQASSNAGVIDLTNDGGEKEDDLQKAIALSLKEQQKVLGGQVSMEDQDISRVVEASLAESKAVGTKRKRGEVWQDPPNPHDRKRNNDWPVGLKNVGNTCWFSAVIQSLFHLPVFRRLVLNFVPPKDWNADVPDTKERRNLLFMQELRKLFSLMVGSKRKYVDPSQALEELREAFPDSSGTDSQQDVSEFSHKLLEWLEEAFKLDVSRLHSPVQDSNAPELPEQQRRNPMLDLFYGHFRSEGLNEGHMFSNEEAFGQYPLQVNGFNDIHESLEAAMAQEIESYHDAMSKSGQESWFTRLPPVLLFELSRFQFNQQLGRPEKIHNKLEFPEVIYMDRYMEYNKNITRSKRDEVRQLKDERDKLQNRLEKYLNYGSGPKRVPLHDVLQYTLEFVESKNQWEPSPSTALSPEDVEMASPASASSMGTDSPCNSPNKVPASELTSSTTVGSPFLHPGNHLPTPLPVVDCEHMQEVLSPTETIPSPRHVSEVELRVLQSCLRRWRTEVEHDVKELQDHINRIDSTIREIYCEQSLQQKPYRLHAVLVHEGQAASGHYWAYVYSPRRGLWLKFNDVTVTEASWAELQKESMGGHHYASAYCLMYVDNQRQELFEETKESEMSSPDCLDGFPEELQRYVEDDNSAFQQELEQWDAEQSRKKDSATMTTLVGGDGECTIVAEKRLVVGESGSVQTSYNSQSLEHAALVFKATLGKVEQLSKMINTHGPATALDEAIRQEVSRLRRLARLPIKLTEDPRLQHVGVYILLNSEISDPYLHWAILEQFTVPELDENPSGHHLRVAALQKLDSFLCTTKENQHVMYKLWHEEYNKFRKLVTLFIIGVDSYHCEKYHKALSYMISCCNLNTMLMSKPPGERKGLDQKLLAHYRRQCVLRLNELAAVQFESRDLKIALEALSAVYDYVVPSMEFLTAPDAYQCDTLAAEEIRSRWCSMLGEEIASQKQEKLQDFLSKLLDPGAEVQTRRSVPLLRIADLEEKFRTTMSLIIKSGEWEAAANTK